MVWVFHYELKSPIFYYIGIHGDVNMNGKNSRPINEIFQINLSSWKDNVGLMCN